MKKNLEKKRGKGGGGLLQHFLVRTAELSLCVCATGAHTKPGGMVQLFTKVQE